MMSTTMIMNMTWNLEELKEGTGESNGEPDTMLNLRKTFAGIFGDMRS